MGNPSLRLSEVLIFEQRCPANTQYRAFIGQPVKRWPFKSVFADGGLWVYLRFFLLKCSFLESDLKWCEAVLLSGHIISVVMSCLDYALQYDYNVHVYNKFSTTYASICTLNKEKLSERRFTVVSKYVECLCRSTGWSKAMFFFPNVIHARIKKRYIEHKYSDST